MHIAAGFDSGFQTPVLGCKVADYTVAIAGQDIGNCMTEVVAGAIFVVLHRLS
jgi:hypothetical protein